MRNEIIRLITNIKTRNERGFEEITEVKSFEMFAEIRSAGVIEKYEAQRAGVDVSIIFMVDHDSYMALIVDGKRPEQVKYDGEIYQIYDVRRKKAYRELEIVCRR